MVQCLPLYDPALGKISKNDPQRMHFDLVQHISHLEPAHCAGVFSIVGSVGHPNKGAVPQSDLDPLYLGVSLNYVVP